MIEVNTSPALFRAGATLEELLPRVIEEVVQKAVDPFLPPAPGTALPDRLDHFELVVGKPDGPAGLSAPAPTKGAAAPPGPVRAAPKASTTGAASAAGAAPVPPSMPSTVEGEEAVVSGIGALAVEGGEGAEEAGNEAAEARPVPMVVLSGRVAFTKDMCT